LSNRKKEFYRKKDNFLLFQALIIKRKISGMDAGKIRNNCLKTPEFAPNHIGKPPFREVKRLFLRNLTSRALMYLKNRRLTVIGGKVGS
jgi:hypothetical protein